MGLQSITLAYFPPNMTSVLQPMDLGIIKNLKQHYRHKLVLQRLEQMEKKQPMVDVNILQAINIVAKAWRTKVSAQTIANCFRKAGFIQEMVEAPDVEVNNSEDCANLEEINRDFNLLKSKTPWQGSFEDFMACDNSVVVSGQLSDEDIVAHVAGDREDEPDELDVNDGENLDPNCSADIVTPKKPTKVEIVTAMKVLIRSLEMTANSSDSMFNNLFDIENHLLND